MTAVLQILPSASAALDHAQAVLPASVHAAAPAAASTLVTAAWQGVALVIVAAITLRMLPNLSAAARSAVWTSVLALAVVLPFAHMPAQSVASASHVAPLHVNTSWSLALAALWAVFSLVRAAQLAASAWHLRGLARRAEVMEAPEAIAALLRAGRRSAELCVSSEVDRPSVAGFFRPRILLPESVLASIAPADLEQIVLHEMEHLKRRDDWVNLAQKIALVLFPLNPALLFIERRLATERELACDDGVLRATSAPKAYALCLASLAEHRLARRTASLALAAWQKQSELALRVERILFAPARSMTRRQSIAAFSLLAFTVLGGAATLAHAPQLVSFAPVASPAPSLFEATRGPEIPASMGAHMIEGVSAALPVAAHTQRTAAHATFAVAKMPARSASAATPSLYHETLAAEHEQPAAHAYETSEQTPRRTAHVRTISARLNAPGPDGEPQQTWLVYERWEIVAAPQQPVSDAPASESAPAAQPQQVNPQPPQQAVPQRPAMVPTYAAVPTPNGWLILQL